LRSALVVTHAGRRQIRRMATSVTEQLRAARFEVRMLGEEARDCPDADVTVVDEAAAAEDAEIVLVFGGDGTFLRAAELARPAGVPMLGVNFGRVGFLAEAEPDELAATVASVIGRRYDVEERTTVDVEVFSATGRGLATSWALNEATVEKSTPERLLEIEVAVDARPLLRFGCDGVICATPTGSTAYAFSAGGPIMWPSVDAMLVVPNAAHALFARPIVVAPTSVIQLELISRELAGVLGCDGRRSVEVAPGGRVTIRRGAQPVRIARLTEWSFGERLVTKFQLPVRGFRDRPDANSDPVTRDIGD
jgi:NAD+ kinase